ncbi:MAG: ABC transporter ATP-binding protein, partial [Pseudomonadota bacterium]|nr:ABC transporter ATP-binding protein [Pseudomonadota bacterium]
DLLQEVIADYEGTVLLVSHDRDFLDRTVTVTLGLDGSGRVDIVAGGYEDWAKRKAPPRHGEGDRRPPARSGGAGGGGGARAPGPLRQASGLRPPRPGEERRKLSYKDQRDLDRLPGEIERIAAEIVKAEQALADPDFYARNPDAFSSSTMHLAGLRAEKAAAENRWLEVAELAERLC